VKIPHGAVKRRRNCNGKPGTAAPECRGERPETKTQKTLPNLISRVGILNILIYILGL